MISSSNMNSTSWFSFTILIEISQSVNNKTSSTVHWCVVNSMNTVWVMLCIFPIQNDLSHLPSSSIYGKRSPFMLDSLRNCESKYQMLFRLIEFFCFLFISSWDWVELYVVFEWLRMGGERFAIFNMLILFHSTLQCLEWWCSSSSSLSSSWWRAYLMRCAHCLKNWLTNIFYYLFPKN